MAEHAEIANRYEKRMIDRVIEEWEGIIEKAHPRNKTEECRNAYDSLKNIVLRNEAQHDIKPDEYGRAATMVSKLLDIVPQGQKYSLLRKNMVSTQTDWESKSKRRYK